MTSRVFACLLVTLLSLSWLQPAYAYSCLLSVSCPTEERSVPADAPSAHEHGPAAHHTPHSAADEGLSSSLPQGAEYPAGKSVCPMQASFQTCTSSLFSSYDTDVVIYGEKTGYAVSGDKAVFPFFADGLFRPPRLPVSVQG